MAPRRTNRSFLYVPADRPERLEKALVLGADAILVDLEDAVAGSAKAAARSSLVTLLPHLTSTHRSIWVRINPGDRGRADLESLHPVAGLLAGLVLAKCERVDWLDEVASLVPSDVWLSPLIESAEAIRSLDALCAHPSVHQCHLGEIDLAADLGVRAGGEPQVIAHARMELLFASASSGLLGPIGGVDVQIRDLDSLAAESAHLFDLGFAGRPAIHPSQIPVINASFSPSADELVSARRLLERYDYAIRNGTGSVTDVDGSMIDEAVVRRARQLVASDRDSDPDSVNPSYHQGLT